ncbi:MAG: CotH kinase family protein [Bacteroidaceae bacterium]|nr:CotH kinase family protein [Bacteroidaceae bacterium]
MRIHNASSVILAIIFSFYLFPIEAQVPYPLRNGYYRLLTFLQYTEGTKAMYASKDYGGWKTFDEDDCTFVWRFDYDVNTGAYKVYNAGTESRFGKVEKSQDVKMSARFDSVETELNVFYEGLDGMGNAVVTLRRADQSGDYEFIHQNSHHNGSGSGGTLVGWDEKATASQWVLHSVTEEEATSLIEAYKPIRDNEMLLEAYSALSASLGTLQIARSEYAETASADVLDEAKALYDEVKMASRNKSYTLQEVYDKINEIEDVISRLRIPRDEYGIMEEDDSLGYTRFYHLTDGSMMAIPRKYIVRRKIDSKNIYLTLPDTSIVIPKVHLVKETNEYHGQLPVFESFKFNNKFNDQLFEDVQGEIDNESNTVTLKATVIGKRLVPSFKVADGVTVYANDRPQKSKKSSSRFDRDKTYKVCRNTDFIYKARRDSTGYAFVPFGRNYTVHVDFPTDHPDAEYGLPIVYINTFDGLPITSKTEYKYASFHLDGAGIWDDIQVDSMQIRGRGNSTWGHSKKPYRLKFAEKIHPMGLKGGKGWVLLANPQSGSMLTNAIAMKMADMVGTAGCNHIMPVEVYLNGDYVGSYNFTEKIGFANNNVNLEDETCAVMLELDTNYDEDWKFHDKSYNLPVNVKHFGADDDPDSPFITLNDIKDAFNEFTEVVALGDGSYVDYVDVDKLVKAQFVADFTLNTELNHPKSTYLYNADIFSDSLWVFGPVWDFDWGFGYMQSSTYFQTHTEKPLLQDSGPFFPAVWLGSDVVKKAYYKLWTDFIDNGGLIALTEYVDDYYQYVSKSFLHNQARWGDGGGYAIQVERAKEWLRDRAAYIYGSIEPYDLDEEEEEHGVTPSLPDAVAPVTIDLARRAGIYTLQGTRMSAGSASELPSGIYIINGKKQYVK